MKKILLIGLLLILAAGVASAEDFVSAPDPTGAAYGARPLGMGGAFVALADDTNAVFLNPAGLSGLKDWSMTSMSTQLLQKIDYKLMGGTYKIGVGTLGIGYIGASTTAGLQYDENGDLSSSTPISFASNMALISYGLSMNDAMGGGEDLGNISVGATVKVLSKGFEGIDGATATGIDFDLGISIRPKDSSIAFGGVLKNVAGSGSVAWESGTKENLEQSGKVGASMLIMDNMVGALDLEFFTGGKPMVIHTGIEYCPISFLAIRAGLDQDPISETETASSITAGVGINYQGFRFDYAYRMNPDAEELSNHYFSISFVPQGKEEPKELEAKEVKDAKDVKEVKEVKEGKKTASDNIYQLPEEYQKIKF